MSRQWAIRKGRWDLMVYFVERGASFSLDVGYGDEYFFAALGKDV